MKKRIISGLAMAVFIFCLTVSIAFAGDCGCDDNGPHYQNHAEVTPNK